MYPIIGNRVQTLKLIGFPVDGVKPQHISQYDNDQTNTMYR